MEARNLASVGLSLMLAVNCFMPCYTLAYAKESTDGGASNEQLRENQPERARDGQVDQGPDFQGLLRNEKLEKASSDSELPSATGAGLVYSSAHVLVEASYCLADSLIRLASERAYADESQEVEGVPEEEQKKITSDTGGLELSSGVGESYADGADGGAAAEGYGSDDGAVEGAGGNSPGLDGGLDDEGNFFERVLGSLDNITYILGEIADYYRQGQGGIQPLVDDVYHQILGAIQTTNSKIDSLNAVSLGSAAASNRINWTIVGSSFNTSKGGISWLISAFYYTVNNRLSFIQTYSSSLPDISANSSSLLSLLQKQWGVGYGGTIVIEKGSPMDLLGKVQRNSDYVTSLYGLIQKQWGYGFGGTVVTEKGSPFDLLGKIQRNSDYITSLDSRATVANDLLGKIQRNSDFITSLDSRVSIVNDLLGKIQRNSDFITSLDSRLERYYPAHSQLVSNGFSDVLDRLGSLSVSVEVDLSGIESRLDSIVRLLTVAGVVENAKDVLDAIFGDMSFDATEAASAAVGGAIQNAFPFCVPAVLKQILGLLQADPAPPEFHFDFWGAPLDFGFEDWGGLADMTGWLSRIGFAVMLFASSRRFVYSGGVAGD